MDTLKQGWLYLTQPLLHTEQYQYKKNKYWVINRTILSQQIVSTGARINVLFVSCKNPIVVSYIIRLPSRHDFITTRCPMNKKCYIRLSCDIITPWKMIELKLDKYDLILISRIE